MTEPTKAALKFCGEMRREYGMLLSPDIFDEATGLPELISALREIAEYTGPMSDVQHIARSALRKAGAL